MANSAIYIVNSTQPKLDAGSQIPFGSVIRRFGPNLKLEGDTLTMCGSGYYKIACDVTYVPTAFGLVAVQLLLDGEPILGAYGANHSLGEDKPISISIASPLVRLKGCDDAKALSAEISMAGMLHNFALSVEKI